jgi:hypothetical protein
MRSWIELVLHRESSFTASLMIDDCARNCDRQPGVIWAPPYSNLEYRFHGEHVLR